MEVSGMLECAGPSTGRESSTVGWDAYSIADMAYLGRGMAVWQPGQVYNAAEFSRRAFQSQPFALG